MAYVAVLDACVLYSFGTRDILLRLAEYELFRPVWNATILDEMARNLTRDRTADGERLRSLIMEAFEDGMDDLGPRFEPSVPDSVSPKDRHVVATALAQHANVIVTSNLGDFPHDALDTLGVAVQHPDEFLIHQLSLERERTLQAILDQVADSTRPPFTLARLRHCAPQFAAAVCDLSPGLPE